MTGDPITSGMDPYDPFIELQSGTKWKILNPNPDDVHADDMAGALSKVCRFGGHVKEFYSVAEHCIHGAEYFFSEGCNRLALHFLLHDASEAYLVDIPRPIKRLLTQYQRIEEATEEAIAEAYGLTWPWPAEVKELDNRLLVTEQRDLMPQGPSYYPEVQPLNLDLKRPLNSKQAEALWIWWHKALSGVRL